MGIIMYQLL
jgi:serine/threonine protein kinase